jgi:peptidoglycan/LPS O-acetylase OafA/YrhL
MRLELYRGVRRFPADPHARRRKSMTLSTILIIILILILLGAIPAWPHSRGWGYGPSGIVGVILVVLLILLLMGRI